MIAFIKGKIEEKFAGSVVLDVAGVGYEVAVSETDFDSLAVGVEAKLYTYHYVREQSEQLFGFASLAAKRLFELLISVQGVGPKAGLAIMSLGDSETVRNAIANRDAKFIGAAGGIGKKTAEKVVIDLSDRVGLPRIYDQTGSNAVAQLVTDDALDALIALGYNLSDATNALKDVPADLPVETRIKRALQGK